MNKRARQAICQKDFTKDSQFVRFYPRTTRNSRHFWQILRLENVLLIYLRFFFQFFYTIGLDLSRLVYFVQVLDNFTQTLISEKFHICKRPKKRIQRPGQGKGERKEIKRGKSLPLAVIISSYLIHFLLGPLPSNSNYLHPSVLAKSIFCFEGQESSTQNSKDPLTSTVTYFWIS